MSSITLCLVVRNEAMFIGPCLDSASHLVDEIVLVDTGSTDGTSEIAASAGATVLHREFPGDLGRAHDLPLEHATCDWILTLDGDEALDARRGAELSQLVSRPDVDAYRFTVRNYQFRPGAKWRPADPTERRSRGASGWTPSTAIRLFRNHRGYRNVGRLHQTVAPSILEAGGTIADADLPIHHYGFLRVDRAKGDFYVDLATRQVRDTPESAQSWLELGVALASRPHSSAAALYCFFRSRKLGMEPTSSYLIGRTWIDLDHPQRALAPLRQAIEHNTADGDPVFDLADAWEDLAEALEDCGQMDDAEDAYRLALSSRPDSPRALNNLAGMLAERARPRESECLLARLLPRYSGLPLVWATKGVVSLTRGDATTAIEDFRIALDIEPQCAPARLNLAAAHASRGETAEAKWTLRAAQSTRGGEVYRELVPREARCDPPLPSPEPSGRLGPGGVVSVADHLVGGSARVLVDVVRALHGFCPQLVLVGDAGDFTGQQLREELEELGVPIRTFGSAAGLAAWLRVVRPEVVVQHWWSALVRQPPRVGQEKWIAVGHAPLPIDAVYDHYVYQSDFQLQFQRHLPCSALHRIPNSADSSRFRSALAASSPTPDPPAPIKIAMLTRLDPEKMPRRLLHYLPPLDALDARLEIAGRGARRWEIEPEIAAAGLSRRVEFRGPLSHKQVPAFLAQADIGLHLTETHQETHSLTLLEMLTAGLPIVAQPRGCIPEMVTHGRNGFLVESEDGVAQALRRLLESEDLRTSMARASRELARQFDFPIFQRRWRELIRQVGDQAGTEDPGRAEGSLQRSAPGSPTDTPLNVRPLLSSVVAWSGRRARPLNHGSTAYVVAATPRSGSSLLCSCLASTGLAGHPEEMFAPGTLAAAMESGEHETPADYVVARLQQSSTPNGVFACRLMFRQAVHLLRSLAREQQPGHGIELGIERLGWIWIRRRDRLRQSISLAWEQETATWIQVDRHSPIASEPPQYDRALIDRCRREIAHGERGWARFFDACSVVPAEVIYEDLVEDLEGTTARILGALEIEAPPGTYPVAPWLQQQSDETNEQWLLRYREEGEIERTR